MLAILEVEDEAFMRNAAKRRIFAYISKERDAEALQSSLDVVLSEFAESTAWRCVCPPGDHRASQDILMERHAVDEKRAFEMLGDEAHGSNRKIVEIA